MSESLVTVGELAAHLHVGRTTAHRLAALPDFPTVKIGRSIRFRLSDVDAWLNAGGHHA